MRTSRHHSRPLGFTLIELVIVITIISAAAVFTVPRVTDSIVRESVRSARRQVTAQLARARNIASTRACRSVFHVVAGSDARVWITACAPGGGTDTVGAVERLTDRYGVSVTSSKDSISFAPNGLALATDWTSFAFTKSAHTDSLSISPVGKAVW